uniref:Uncharacterized protein n=1 Tax=Tanacetum cinerariifolium TaxID=118510 RepID=A0A699HP11_TANCI|nr:hypothetical protein [Tanacetum cinerariifolium]
MLVGEERHIEDEEEDELYRDVNINQGRGIQETLEVEDSHVTLNPINPDGMESIFETTSQMDVQNPTSVAPLPILRTLEANFFEFMQTNQFAEALFAISEIVQRYMDQRMNEAVKVAVQILFDRLCDEAQRENDKFLKTVDENMKNIIKEQVKEQVKVQVSKILPRIEQTVNEQLEAEFLTRSSHSSKTSYDVAADLSEMELKKILIMKIETITLKRRRDDDADKDEEPSAGPGRGSKRPREGKEHESASAPKEKATRKEPMQTTFQMEEPSHPEFDTCAEDQPVVQSSQHPEWFSQQHKPPTLDCNWNKTLPAIHRSIQPWISKLAMQTDSRSSFNELMDTPLDFSNFLINRLKVDTLTLELLAGPTNKLMKGSCKSLVELEYHLEEVFKATTDQLDWVNPEDYGHIKWIEDMVPRTMRIKEPIGYDKHALWGVSHWGCKRQQFYGFTVNRESARGVYSKRRIIAITELKIVEWHNYKHLDWITHRDPEACGRPSTGCRKLPEEAQPNKAGFVLIDGMLTNVRTALDDRLKGIRMQYLPQSIWRKSDKEKVTAMIQAIDKRLKTRRIIRSLERCIERRLYEEDFRMLQRTI